MSATERCTRRGAIKGSRQRYPMLLLVLTVTFCFYGIAQPLGLYRAIGTALVGAIDTTGASGATAGVVLDL